MQEARVDFEDRAYRLGETIDLRVELNPRGDLDVREGRVELICEETYKITESVRVSGRPSRADAGYAWAGKMQTGSVGVQVSKERKESYVHSSAVFGERGRLEAETKRTYDVRFEIGPEPPYYSKEGTVKWRLVTVIDVIRGRNPRVRRTVKIALD